MKKISNIVFIFLVFIMLIIPLMFMNLKDNQISLSENRKLNEKPTKSNVLELLSGEYFDSFNSWFKDHIGFRDNIISLKGNIDYNLFSKIDVNYMYVGKNKELLYLEPGMLKSYQHKDLLSETILSDVVNNYNIINDYFNSLGIKFLYVPCYDKHSILPEQVQNSINQYGSISKVDQIVKVLTDDGNVTVVNFKDDLIKAGVETYGVWSDPTHWTDYGSHLAYLSIMKKINEIYKVNILSDTDYDIYYENRGYKLNGNRYHYENYKVYKINNPKAKKIEPSILGEFASDNRHSVYYNEIIDNDLKLLIIGDSYMYSFLVEDFAESFKYTYMLWNGYLKDDNTIKLINSIKPDIVIIENAERVGIQTPIKEFANKVK